MNARARNFIAANEVSPVVYCSVDGGCVTYRLANGQLFHLNTYEAQQAPNPRWIYLERELHAKARKAVDRENKETLARLNAEACR